MVTGYKKLTQKQRRKLDKFIILNYEKKNKLKENNVAKYNHLINLLEQSIENRALISHKNYRSENQKYDKQIVELVNPAFFISINYQDSVASTIERVASKFASIKCELRQSKDYKFVHYIEQGDNGNYHSHIFVSTIKSKRKSTQIVWLYEQLVHYQKINKFAIANGTDSIDVRLYDDKRLNLKKELRVSYANKTSNKNHLSLDINNSDNLIQ
jgi:hypothetical protein